MENEAHHMKSGISRKSSEVIIYEEHDFFLINKISEDHFKFNKNLNIYKSKLLYEISLIVL